MCPCLWLCNPALAHPPVSDPHLPDTSPSCVPAPLSLSFPLHPCFLRADHRFDTLPPSRFRPSEESMVSSRWQGASSPKKLGEASTARFVRTSSVPATLPGSPGVKTRSTEQQVQDKSFLDRHAFTTDEEIMQAYVRCCARCQLAGLSARMSETKMSMFLHSKPRCVCMFACVSVRAWTRTFAHVTHIVVRIQEAHCRFRDFSESERVSETSCSTPDNRSGAAACK